MQWEYKVNSLKGKTKGFVSTSPDNHDLELLLNELGRQNWELVSCQLASNASGFGNTHSQAVLKRPR